MAQFRLAILDYTKEQLNNPIAQKMFNDILFEKQKNFLRTDSNYVVMDKHDMIGTHYLIYETSNLIEPKLIFAIRTTYLHRAQQHKIETPLQTLVPLLTEFNKNQFLSFQQNHPQLVDCNAWFVHPEFSKKNSGLNLSAIGYFLVIMNVLRFGYDNIVGCTNERYNASKWLEGVGKIEDSENFIHPTVNDPHKLMLVSNFNLKNAKKIYEAHKELFENAFEVFPESFSSPYSLSEFCNMKLNNEIKPNELTGPQKEAS